MSRLLTLVHWIRGTDPDREERMVEHRKAIEAEFERDMDRAMRRVYQEPPKRVTVPLTPFQRKRLMQR